MIRYPTYIAVSYFFDVSNQTEAELVYNTLLSDVKHTATGIAGLRIDFCHIQEIEKMIRMVEELADIIEEKYVESKYETSNSAKDFRRG